MIRDRYKKYPEGLLLDPEDAAYFKQFHIWVTLAGYAACKLGPIHSIIMKPAKGLVVDHINRNRLDSRRSNMRCITQQENVYNRNISLRNSSGVTGVSWLPRDSVWHVVIQFAGKRKYLGRTADFFEAVCLRKAAELIYHTPFTVQNMC
jgi:hypothetical protein